MADADTYKLGFVVALNDPSGGLPFCTGSLLDSTTVLTGEPYQTVRYVNTCAQVCLVSMPGMAGLLATSAGSHKHVCMFSTGAFQSRKFLLPGSDLRGSRKGRWAVPGQLAPGWPQKTLSHTKAHLRKPHACCRSLACTCVCAPPAAAHCVYGNGNWSVEGVSVGTVYDSSRIPAISVVVHGGKSIFARQLACQALGGEGLSTAFGAVFLPAGKSHSGRASIQIQSAGAMMPS